MILFRCTGRVLKRFGCSPSENPAQSSGCLGAWYANLLNVGATRYVLCTNERSLLSVIMPQRQAEFPTRFSAYLEPVLREIGIPDDIVRSEVAETSEWDIAKTASRSILGAMNDFSYLAKRHFEVESDPLAVALRLAGTPSGLLQFYMPDETACHILGVPKSRRKLLREMGITDSGYGV